MVHKRDRPVEHAQPDSAHYRISGSWGDQLPLQENTGQRTATEQGVSECAGNEQHASFVQGLADFGEKMIYWECLNVLTW